MIYPLLEGVVSRVLRIPPAPGAPPGDEGTTRVFRASPRYYTYRLVGWVLLRILAMLAVFSALVSMYATGSMVEELGVAMRVVGVFVVATFLAQTLFSYVALRLDYEKRWYLLTDRSLRIRQGVQQVTEMTITFANIQNISVSQGPIQRLFGISDLRVDTAGGAGHTAQTAKHGGMSMHTAFFRGVDDAARIRGLMQERLRKLKDAGLGDLDDREQDDDLPLPEGLALPPAAGAATPPGDLTEVLRQVRDEARALRAAASR